MVVPDFYKQPQIVELRKVVADLKLRICAPFYWHDGPPPAHIRGGSSFVLNFAGALVGVTAAHVFRELQKFVKESKHPVPQFSNAVFDPSTLIDIDDDLDIATFRVSEAQLEIANKIAIDCETWPPPVPEKGDSLGIIGFPELMREVEDEHALFSAYGAFPIVEDVTEKWIIVVYDPKIDKAENEYPLPPLRLNLSGCSGGPALLFRPHHGLLRWYPVGLIASGPGEMFQGEVEEFDIIRIIRTHLINQDGTLQKVENRGWLPM